MHVLFRHIGITMLLFNAQFCQMTSFNDWLNIWKKTTATNESFCPHDCSCTRINLATLLNNYVDSIAPQLGSHMRPSIAAQSKELLSGNFLGAIFLNYTFLTEIMCVRNETFSLKTIVEKSLTRQISLDLTCTDNATLVWDLTDRLRPIYSIRIVNCTIHTVTRITLSSFTWIVHLDRVNPSATEEIEFSTPWMLVALSVTNSSLDSIPWRWTVHNLPRLTFLNLEGNFLTDYDCSIKIGGTVMETIYLANNALKRIPSCILSSKHLNLSHLCLANNNIEEMSELFEESSNNSHSSIQFLNLKNNSITSLGKFYESNVMALDLSHNRITTLPNGVFDNLQLLKWLDLTYNRIADLGRGTFKKQFILKYANLSNNKLTEVTFDQGPVSTNIVNMDLTHNHLRYPPFHDTNYISPRLTKISIANNPFVCDCKMKSFHQFMEELNRTAYLNFVALKNVQKYFETDNSLVQPYIDVNSAKCFQPLRKRSMPILNVDMTTQCPVVEDCPQSCVCFEDNNNLQLVINCSRTITQRLPLRFPTRAVTLPVVFILDNSYGLETFEYRNYLSSLSELHASNASVRTITASAISAMRNIHVLHLHDNSLSQLPKEITTISFDNLKSLTLHGNPWQCDCNTTWFPKWLKEHKNATEFYINITCQTYRGESKPIYDISSSDFRCSVISFLYLVIIFSCLIVLAALAVALVYKYRLEIRVVLYTRFRWRPFDNFRFDNDEKEFDAFVSYSDKDHMWIVNNLVKTLEGPQYERKLCVHYRDFPVGSSVVENILWAISSSRCTLLLLTNDFLQSEWCMLEFQEAHRTLLHARSNKLIILLKGDVERNKMDDDLKAYLRTHTYLDVRDKWFWAKLNYVVPAGAVKIDIEENAV